MNPFDPQLLIKLLDANDPRAVDEMERLSDLLREKAHQLREYHASAKDQHDFISTPGFTDRVKINVVSPDGTVLQSHDTGSTNVGVS